MRPEAGVQLGVIGLRLATLSLVAPRRVRTGQLDGVHTCFERHCGCKACWSIARTSTDFRNPNQGGHGGRRPPAPVRRFAAGAPNAQQWHGRMDHDPAHKWLREQVREASVWLDSADVLYSRSHATAEHRNGDTVTVAASAAVHRSSRSASAWFLG